MTHQFPIKEIAAQSGLSTATVDRVLNDRPNVSSQARARVVAAMAELEAQSGQLAARGRRLFVDIVTEAPLRFTRAVQTAAVEASPMLHPVVLRPHFTMHEVLTDSQMQSVLQRIAKRGSHGVCLKARDTALLRRMIADLGSRGIPVVTLVTDCPTSDRLAYAGLDNNRAGQTAGQLMAGHLTSGKILTLQSNTAFTGEEERQKGFQEAMQLRAPQTQIIRLRNMSGLDTQTGQAVEQALREHGRFDGVYSVGGGNRAVWAAFDRAGQRPRLYIGHDLDADNLGLLEQERLTYVLHHDLKGDMVQAFRQIMAHHRIIPPEPCVPSDIQIILPGNIPHRFRKS